MEKELHCIREASHYLPSVAFTAQDIRHIPTTNSTRWYQLWAQSQHAYCNKTIAEKNWWLSEWSFQPTTGTRHKQNVIRAGLFLKYFQNCGNSTNSAEIHEQGRIWVSPLMKAIISECWKSLQEESKQPPTAKPWQNHPISANWITSIGAQIALSTQKRKFMCCAGSDISVGLVTNFKQCHKNRKHLSLDFAFDTLECIHFYSPNRINFKLIRKNWEWWVTQYHDS